MMKGWISLFAARPFPDGDLYPTRSTRYLCFMHRCVCLCAGMLSAFCIFRCYLSFSNALQDVYKYEHTETFAYFLHFLGEYHFLETLCMSMLVIAELVLYIFMQHRATQTQFSKSGIVYFAIFFGIHAIIWIHSNSMQLPDFSPSTIAEEAGMRYRFFANITVLPSASYLFLYLLRARNTGASRNM